MNGKKAKALRADIGFHPASPRQYFSAHTIEKFSFDVAKNFERVSVTHPGTIKTQGTRRQYQAIKRRGMTNIVLGAK